MHPTLDASDRSCAVRRVAGGEASHGVIGPRQREAFLQQLRNARAAVLGDAESFASILFVIERLGSYLLGQTATMDAYRCDLARLVRDSALAAKVPEKWRQFHTPFGDLYEIVRRGRNDALHQGAFARNLAGNSVMLSLIVEDALMHSDSIEGLVADFMVREVVVAEPWQPVSFARQQMLANSFSCLPLQQADGAWKLLSDESIARFLCTGARKRKARLAMTIERAESEREAPIVLANASLCSSATRLSDALPLFAQNGPLLIHDDSPGPPGAHIRVIGILTAFDCL